MCSKVYQLSEKYENIDVGQIPKAFKIFKPEFKTLRDNFLQDFRSNEKIVINEAYLELGDEPYNLITLRLVLLKKERLKIRIRFGIL